MKKFLTMAVALTAVVLSAGDGLKWNADNAFAGWHRPVGMTMTQENGLLILDVTKPDSGMRNLSVSIAPEDFGALEIDYRATGLPKVNHGEFYYAGNSNDFAESRVWRHWNMDVSGEWKTLRIDGGRFPRKPAKDCGRITKLRLDLTNQAPGRIEIKEIRIVPTQRPFVWNAANKFAGWQKPAKMTMKQENGLLILDVTDRDSGMINLGSRIPAGEYDALEVDYRATGFKAKNQGEFYYANDKQGFAESRVWRHWNLKVDGEWHTLRINGKKFKYENWLDAGTVTRLRLDMIDCAPGRIEIKEIRLMEAE